jgi:HAD superfamily hydrolase (TIGR01509 family)
MFDYIGIQRPEKNQYKRIYYEAAKFVDLRAKASFPGVIKTMKIISKEGYNLYTASGTESIELKYYLKGVGIKKYFKNFYGPDLINILKVDAAFYKAIFNDLNIPPNQAIIIDDKPYYLKIAKSLGAHVIQACLKGEFKPEFNYYITDMKNLPEIIETLREENT